MTIFIQQEGFTTIRIGQNNLETIITFLQNKCVVVLYAKKKCLMYHSLSQETPSELTSEKVRTIYINCNTFPSIVLKRKFENAIKIQVPNLQEIEDPILRKKIKKFEFPNQLFLSIDYKVT